MTLWVPGGASRTTTSPGSSLEEETAVSTSKTSPGFSHGAMLHPIISKGTRLRAFTVAALPSPWQGMRVPERMPIVVQLFLAVSRLLSIVNRLFDLIRNEFLWAVVPTSHKYKVNMLIHSREKDYLPGGHWFNVGLFEWERKAVTFPPFPGKGRLLLGAAGGGREIKGLSELGYEVYAFEPCEELYRGALSVLSQYPSSKIVQLSYAGFVETVRERKNPFSNDNGSFDAIVLGWGSFSHLLDPKERESLLRSLHERAPLAPVLLSFIVPELRPPPSRIARLRPFFQRFLRAIGCTNLAKPGDVFLPGSGFLHLPTPEEIKEVAARTGYSVHHGDLAPYPHAVLVPHFPR